MSDKEIVPLPLHSITTSHNPRRPARTLQRNLENEGYAGWTVQQLIHGLALSDDAEKQAEYVRLLEKHEWRIARDDKQIIDPESVVELAASIRQRQIEPIMVRRFTVEQNGQHLERYGVICGERRMMAAAYNHAKHGDAAQVFGTVIRISVEQARKLAWEENRRRKPPTHMEVALYFHDQLEEHRAKINPATGRRWTMKEVAAALDEDYQQFRRYEALAHLPEADQRRLDLGQVGLVASIQKAIALKNGRGSDEPVRPKLSNRRRVKTLKEVEGMFDAAPRNRTGYLQALAEVMGIHLEVAIKESDARKATAEAA